MKRLDPLAFFIIVTGVSLWVGGSLRRSLWTDELHSLNHVRCESLGEFLSVVRTDNHPPLSFLAERASVDLFGESELALRLPSLFCGLAFLLLLARLVRPFTRGERCWVLAFAALSSYALVIFSEARMYAWLATASLGLVVVVVEHLTAERERPPWSAAFWVALGLHSHYYFVHDLFALVVLLAVVGWWRSAGRPVGERLLTAARLRGFFLPITAGVLLWGPWAAYGFLSQLNQDYPPGGHRSGLADLLQSLFHFLFMNTAFGGELLRKGIALPAAVVAAFLVAVNVAAFVLPGRRAAEAERHPPSELAARRWVTLTALVVGVGVPVWAMGIAQVFERASYGWRYVAGSLGCFLVLVGTGVPGRARTLARATVLAAVLAVTVVNLVGGEREDYRAMVQRVLAECREGDAVVVKPLWDPRPEKSPDGWTYYADRIETEPRPLVVPIKQLNRAFGQERVWVFQRDPYSAYVLGSLRGRFARVESWTMGLDLELYLFSDPRN